MRSRTDGEAWPSLSPVAIQSVPSWPARTAAEDPLPANMIVVLYPLPQPKTTNQTPNRAAAMTNAVARVVVAQPCAGATSGDVVGASAGATVRCCGVEAPSKPKCILCATRHLTTKSRPVRGVRRTTHRCFLSSARITSWRESTQRGQVHGTSVQRAA